jgi:hypothetical protein
MSVILHKEVLKYHVIKVYGGLEVKPHTFLTLT